MPYGGADLHTELIVIRVVHQSRKPLAGRRIPNTKALELVAWLTSLSALNLVLEATAGFEWFLRLAEPLARRIVLAHFHMLRIITQQVAMESTCARATR